MLKKRKDKSAYYESVFEYNYQLANELAQYSHHYNQDKKRAAFSIFDHQQNNIIKAIGYIGHLQVTDEKIIQFIDDSSVLFISICSLQSFIVAIESEIQRFVGKTLQALNSFLFIARYYNGDFDQVYKELEANMPIESLEKLNYGCLIERHTMLPYYGIYEMEGHELMAAKFENKYNRLSHIYKRSLFALGELDLNYALRCKLNSSAFEALYILGELDKIEIETYIEKLHEKSHLQLVNSCYLRSKILPYSHDRIIKLIVVNPYAQGLIYLMYAFSENNVEAAQVFYQKALPCLKHIKYYFVEATYYYAKFLKENELDDFQVIFDEGYSLAKKHYYRYLQYCFEELETPTGLVYDSKHYPLPDGVDFTDYIAKLTKHCIRNN
ncbi:hypothetical protein [Psychromonas hadalis]|uniref:hypothetical protein n=1 Tax=Psychromonas hadalis TaxID=211669 RepID=UPI0003B62A57|nr:hypothetical protein [Psychromonas hadalis]